MLFWVKRIFCIASILLFVFSDHLPASGQTLQETGTKNLPLSADAQIPLVPAVSIAVGDMHSCAMTIYGGAKCWGSNYLGQIGDGTTSNRLMPVDVVGLTADVAAIDGGHMHTCALMISGGVKCWGYNIFGQLGDGTTTDRHTPVDVVGLSSGVTAIAVGDYHTCALLANGGVKCWGQNGTGQLGSGNNKASYTPVQVSGLVTGATAIAAGDHFSCALMSYGEMKCWGYNADGRLGDGTKIESNTPVSVLGLETPVTAITAGDTQACAVSANGGARCWGTNSHGQLGDGTYIQRSIPVDVLGLTSGVNAMNAGAMHSCAVLESGGAMCWGDNQWGQLGDETDIVHPAPVEVSGLTTRVRKIAAGYLHTCALMQNGGVKCWGDNVSGQLGDGTNIQRLTPIDVIGFGSWQISIPIIYAPADEAR